MDIFWHEVEKNPSSGYGWREFFAIFLVVLLVAIAANLYRQSGKMYSDFGNFFKKVKKKRK